jgi:hypothetical protein
MNTTLPTDRDARKAIPIATGFIDYFPAAIAAVASLSKAGNDIHNPGQPLHWSRGKSNDHADTIMRHFLERGTIDQDDGIRHSVKLAWRAMALLQLELEAEGAPLAPGAKLPELGTIVPVHPDQLKRFNAPNPVPRPQRVCGFYTTTGSKIASCTLLPGHPGPCVY